MPQPTQPGLVKQSHDKQQRDTEQQMEKGPGTGSFPILQPMGHLHQGLLSPGATLLGTKCHRKGLLLSFFILFSFTAPEGSLSTLQLLFPILLSSVYVSMTHLPSDPAASPEGISTWLDIMNNGGRTSSEAEAFEFYRERTCSEKCSLSLVHRFKILLETSRKAGKG